MTGKVLIGDFRSVEEIKLLYYKVDFFLEIVFVKVFVDKFFLLMGRSEDKLILSGTSNFNETEED